MGIFSGEPVADRGGSQEEDADEFGSQGSHHPSEPPQSQPSPATARGRGRGVKPPKKTIGKGKDPKPANAKAKAGKVAKGCFVDACPVPKKANSRFCKDHHPDQESILYQAKANGEEALKLATEALHCKVRCPKLLAEWRMNNPPGSSRKKLIDFTKFNRAFGYKAVKRSREGMERLDLVDFTHYWCRRNFCDPLQSDGREKARIAFDKELGRTGVDKETEDGKEYLWVELSKKRHKDKEQYMEGQVNQSSKDIKDISEKQMGQLLGFTKTGMILFCRFIDPTRNISKCIKKCKFCVFHTYHVRFVYVLVMPAWTGPNTFSTPPHHPAPTPRPHPPSPPPPAPNPPNP
jgi:hypothetical protein